MVLGYIIDECLIVECGSIVAGLYDIELMPSPPVRITSCICVELAFQHGLSLSISLFLSHYGIK